MNHFKLLNGAWSPDTMDACCKSLDGNSNAQVFANQAYFANVYPMNKKSQHRNTLKLFYQEFIVPGSLTVDGLITKHKIRNL